ncbi:hypothetical protein LPC08_24505 (plasmid) [Roseomonas sp. OT10]|nr:hypothetical protein [Roseomonas sp. OT10]UFN51685.1 hypothetical protein LPC08_24505 [Roseomonas sp. OT10]
MPRKRPPTAEDHRRALRPQSEATEAYRLMLTTMHEGRRSVQSDLFT